MSAAAAPALAAALPPGAMIQPRVSEPASGFWPIERIFPTPPQSEYSESGRRHLLFEVQRILKEKSLYASTQDGKEGKGTHNAIILYQAKNGLVPNGLLDGPTLAALSLFDKPDDNEWRPPPPANAESGAGFRRSRPVPQEKEDPSFLRRAGKSIGRFFNQDD
jgi:peptidoglycan hydrolase-like protein with peptidoglycan-binding domain